MILKCIAERNAKLASFLRRELRLSTTLINRLKVQNAMFVNDRPEHADYPVVFGDVVSVQIEEADPIYPAEDAELKILYEDEALIAIDKPADLLIHPSRTRNTGTLANRLAYYYRETGQKCAVHPVSRLDRDTFGVVLLAKNAHIHALMGAAHDAKQIRKTYHAAIWGHLPEAEGVIDLPIARLDPMGLLRGVREDGQPSQTEYRVLRREEKGSLVELYPLTGRTHQLRVHLSYLGCPILGDPQYGSEASQEWSLLHGLTGQQLCAVSLSFSHPLTGEPMTIHSGQQVILPRD